MNKNSEQLFNEIFHITDTSTLFTTIDDLHTITGLSLYEIRNCIEDLKEYGFLVEEERGIQVSASGQSEARTKWLD